MNFDDLRKESLPEWLACFLVIAVVMYALVLDASFPEFMAYSTQEDEYLEWATFWGFLVAAGVAVKVVLKERKSGNRFPWFTVGLSLFCFFVAMEEISWGQRVLGYQPPEYFLEHNSQQEFNFHNMVSGRYTKWAFYLIVNGYGIALPLLARMKTVGGLLARFGIVPPPLRMLPAFIVILFLLVWYPWPHTPEWVELMLGLGFMFILAFQLNTFAPLDNVQHSKGVAQKWVGPKRVLFVFLFFMVVFGLGVASAKMSQMQRTVHPGNLTAVRVELNALKEDYDVSMNPSCIDLHLRVYEFVNRSNVVRLRLGKYRFLQMQGLPEERAHYFVDPWHMSYWIYGDCSPGNEYLYLYSFGPNRVRDSFSSEVRGDDIGVYLIGGK